MKFFFIPSVLISTVMTYAGDLNILHVAATPILSVEITAQGKSQTIQLETSKNTGAFTLPNTSATLKTTDDKCITLDIPAGETSHIAVLYTKDKNTTWHLIPTKKNENANALRVLNLTDNTRSVVFGGQAHKVDSFQMSDLGQTDKESMKIQVDGGNSRSIKPEDPGAYIAIIYPSENGNKVSFIAE